MPDKTREEVIKELVEKTMRELNTPVKPVQDSRVWKDPEGYMYLGVWQNTALLRVLIRVFTKGLPRNEYRLKAQLDDAARSVKRNIEEGYKRPTTSEYLQFLGYSQASLEEVKGDIRDAKTDGFLKSLPFTTLKGIGLNLRVIKGPNKGQIKGEPTDQDHPYSLPLSTLNSNDLTYEIFIELVNKTDYLLRVLVQSLEKKLSEDQKYYQVEQAKIKDKFKKY